MYIYFTKMQGLGNDFIVIDNVRYHTTITPAMVRTMADRHFGIGFDQLLLVEPPELPDIDFNYRIFNHDGSEVAQCGNGARCFMRFVLQQGLTNKDCIRVKTRSGVLTLKQDHTHPDFIAVNMGRPQFDPQALPFLPDTALPDPDQIQTEYRPYVVQVAGEWLKLYLVSMGNPHAICLQEDNTPIHSDRLTRLGQEINQHAQFPDGVNLSFMTIANAKDIYLQVYERGAGQTLACGTAACAAVAVAQRYALLGISHQISDQSIQVHLPGGALYIRQNHQGEIIMTGPANTVFTGRIRLDAACINEGCTKE